MFKALIAVTMLLLILVVIVVSLKLIQEFKRTDEKPLDSIDKIISDLEDQIELAELQASRGVETAKENLQKYQSELEKAKKIKNKLNKK